MEISHKLLFKRKLSCVLTFVQTCAVFGITSFCFGQAQSRTGDLPVIPAVGRNGYVAVLVWHDVTAGKKDVWFDTTLDTFHAQLETIKRRHFNVITLEALYKHLTEGAPLPPRPLVFTFDDNNRGLYENAFPLLKKYHFPATLFVHTDYVGVTTSKPHCDWHQLKEMQNSGLITIQSLTASHPPDIRKFTDAMIDKELQGSRSSIAKHLGTSVYAFVYPEDRYDARVARLVARNGYKLAFTEDWGNACASPNFMMIHRYSILKRFQQALDNVAYAWKNVK